jgi:hypothetical protein
MKKVFKVEAIYEGSSIYYALYKRRFLFYWKYITKFSYKESATQAAKELSKPAIYIEYKK